MLRKITLLRDKVTDWESYPFCVPAIRALDELTIRSQVCFFAGENGSGKSTLLEAIAAHYGFGREGGTRNFRFSTTDSNESIDPLVKALRLAFTVRTGAGFYLRAESFFNVASHIDKLDQEPGFSAPISEFYGGRSLHTRSHGETFFKVIELKMRRKGLFLLDEPEGSVVAAAATGVSGVDARDVEGEPGRAVHYLDAFAVAAGVSGGADYFV